MRTEVKLLKELPEIQAGTVGIGSQFDGLTRYSFYNGTWVLTFSEDQIKSLPDWFEIKTIYEPEDVKEGTYWKSPNHIRRIKKNEDNKVYYRNITLDTDGMSRHFIENDILMTTPEISAALIKEAERRGYKVGTRIRSIGGANTYTLEGTDTKYDAEYDELFYRRWRIYSKGTWAQIIEEKKEPSKPNPTFKAVETFIKVAYVHTSKAQSNLDRASDMIKRLKQYKEA